MYLFSKETGGFYLPEIHGDAIPPDAVEVSEEEHAGLMEAQSAGKYICADDNGFPVAMEQPSLSPEQLASAAAYKRDRLLQIAALRIAPLQDAADLGEITAAEQSLLTAWKQYRVAVNRFDPGSGNAWPEPPGDLDG